MNVYVIFVYDVAVDRIDAVRGLLRQYLNWVQNSAFEGELTIGTLEELILKLSDLVDETHDSVIIYTISNSKWLKKRVIGIQKSEISTVM